MVSTEAARSDRNQRRTVLACAAASLLAGLVYLNALHNPFIYDDHQMVVDNPSIRHLFDLRFIVLYRVTRPFVNLSYAIDRAVWGPQPFGFHLTNVLLHMLNVALLFRLARPRWGERSQPVVGAVSSDVVAFAAAILFAVHPLMTEAVGYISGRAEVLCGTFFLFGVLCARRWMRGDGETWWLLTVAVGCWAAAIATKEIGVMFPLVLVCYDR